MRIIVHCQTRTATGSILAECLTSHTIAVLVVESKTVGGTWVKVDLCRSILSTWGIVVVFVAYSQLKKNLDYRELHIADVLEV